MTNTVTASLLRVSTESQESQGFGLPTQRADIQRYAKANGLDIKYELAESVSGDVAISNRKIHSQLLTLIAEKKISAVIAHRADRVARLAFMVQSLVYECLKAGIAFHLVDKGQITSANDIVMLIEGWKAQSDKEAILKKLKAGKQAKIDAGIYYGNKPPYGYQVVGSKKLTKLAIVESEAAVVRFIYESFVAGTSANKIAQQLAEQGVITREGNQLWSTSTIYALLNSPTYKGEFYYGKFKMVEGKRVNLPESERRLISVPQIVDTETWESVQNRLERGKGAINRKFEYLMGHKLTCRCGYSWMGIHKTTPRNGKKYTYWYYICGSQHGAHGKYKNCGTKAIPLNVLDSKVTNFLEELVTSGTFLADLKAEQKNSDKRNKPLMAEMESLQKQIEKNQKRLTRLLTLMLDSDESDDVAIASYKETETGIRSAISGIQERMIKLQADIAENTITDSDIDEWQAEIERIRLAYMPKSPNDWEQVKEWAMHMQTEVWDKQNFQIYSGYIEKLKMTGTITVEEGKRVLYLKFQLGQKRIPIDENSGKKGLSGNPDSNAGMVSLTKRIPLD